MIDSRDLGLWTDVPSDPGSDLGSGATLRDMTSGDTAPPTELAEAMDTQVAETREVLRSAAAAAGVDSRTIDAAIDTAVAAYAGARVHAFLGILVERDVREHLGLRRVPSEPAPGPAFPTSSGVTGRRDGEREPARPSDGRRPRLSAAS